MAAAAQSAGKYNVAFESYFLLQNTDKCIEVLVKAKRIAEATIFAQAYAPSALPALIKQWGAHLQEQGLQYSPDDLPTINADQQKQDVMKEQELKDEFYNKEKQPASEIESVKELYYK